jgi:uncharacterized repeat protein (TIGR03803 family)
MTFTQDSTFTFGDKVSSGGSYNIAVISQPIGQTCTINAGSGQDVTQNISVSISCQSKEAVLFSFDGADGAEPTGALIQATDGNFYGVTSNGGQNGTGAVYRISPWPNWQLTLLYSFGPTTGTDGQNPNGGLIQASDGYMYGTTTAGGVNGTGSVFRISLIGTESTIYSFADSTSGDAMTPYGALLEANDGNLYGTGFNGGANGSGAVFRITTAGSETVVYSFGPGSGPDAHGVRSAFIQASDGDLYGVSTFGGTNNCGTVFKVTLAGVESVLYSFGGNPGPDGSQPNGIIQANDGNFYGTTWFGGPDGNGTVFKLTPAGMETVLYSFTQANSGHGLQPSAGLIQANDGNLYGTTTYGGSNGTGTVFVMTLAGSGSTLYSFGVQPGSDGQNPNQTLVQGSDGNIYGTTIEGGQFGNPNSPTESGGTVFVLH